MYDARLFGIVNCDGQHENTSVLCENYLLTNVRYMIPALGQSKLFLFIYDQHLFKKIHVSEQVV